MLTLRTTTKLASATFLILVTVSCAQNQKVTTDTNASETIVSSTPPFQTKEPERYQATRTITTVNASGETLVTKNSIARDGERRRDESLTGPQRMVYLYLPEGKFLLFPNEKVFAELSNVDQTQASDDSDTSPDRLLHTEPLVTSYQRLGAETINGRNTQKYRAVVNSSGETNVSGSETLIWFDETLHMPIKSETKSGDGKRVTMEMSDISLDVDRVVFQVPEGYQKTTLSDVSKGGKKFDEFPGKP